MQQRSDGAQGCRPSPDAYLSVGKGCDVFEKGQGMANEAPRGKGFWMKVMAAVVSLLALLVGMQGGQILRKYMLGLE